MQSSLSRIDRKVRAFSCKVFKIEGESRRIVIASEAATAREAGVEAEKTKAVPLIRYGRVSEIEKYGHRLGIYLMLNNDGRSSTETACGAETGSNRTDQHVNLGGGDIIKLGEAAAGPSNGSEGESFVEDETILVLALEFDLCAVKVSCQFVMWNDVDLTNFGKSAMDPSRSKIPSVMINRRVNGARRFLLSLLMLSKTSSRLFISLWSNQRMMLREI